MAPPSTFDSFDASALGAIIESPLGARGRGPAILRARLTQLSVVAYEAFLRDGVPAAHTSTPFGRTFDDFVARLEADLAVAPGLMFQNIHVETDYVVELAEEGGDMQPIVGARGRESGNLACWSDLSLGATETTPQTPPTDWVDIQSGGSKTTRQRASDGRFIGTIRVFMVYDAEPGSTEFPAGRLSPEDGLALIEQWRSAIGEGWVYVQTGAQWIESADPESC